MFLCSKSEKCKSDIIKKLFDWKAKPDDHIKITEKLIKEKFIDEERFVRFYVNDKFNFNKWGKIKIRTMLRLKKVPNVLIDKELAKIGEEEYLEMLKNVINQKRKNLKETDPYKQKTRLLRFAAGRGFEPDIILDLLDN